jgi:GDP-L-fucose synthase
MNKNIKKIKKVWVPGYKGMVGSAVYKELVSKGYQVVPTTRKELNLFDKKKILYFLKKNKPDAVILCAARVGGIFANDNFSGDFIKENLEIQINVIDCCKLQDTKKLIFLGSSCIYPKFSKQPIKEEYLLTGALEETNQWYAIAKIAGIKMIQAYRKQFNCNFVSVMPTNLYGPNDNFNKLTSHVIPGMICKFVEAKVRNKKKVILWGTGKPKRDFLHVDDLASSIVFILEKYNNDLPINVGSGMDVKIEYLAKEIAKIVNFKGEIFFDKKFPDGTPRKLLDNSVIKKIGWKPKIKLQSGIKSTVDWYIKNYNIKKN